MTRLSSTVLAIVTALCLALLPAVADAAAGGRGSMGSRGSRTGIAPPPIQTAPTAQPMQRTQTPAQQVQPGMQAARPSFFQRNPFMSGLIGGLIGAGLIGMLFGSGLLPNLDMGGILGLLLQVALIGGIAWLALSWWRRRQAASQPAQPGYAYAGANGPAPDVAARTAETGQPSKPVFGIGGGAPATVKAGHDEVGVTEADYGAFERLLADIQRAWSAADEKALAGLLTAEMQGYFAEQLADLAAKGLRNKVEEVRFLKGDLAEAWKEGDIDYVTVAMRWNAYDTLVRIDTGAVVEGNANVRVETSEIWTFVRERGGDWKLSAIQQVE